MENKTISLYVHEEAMARMERTNVRVSIFCILLLLMLLITNGGWIYYESQFQDVVETTTVTQELDSGEGGNAIINDGVHLNGKGETNGK